MKSRIFLLWLWLAIAFPVLVASAGPPAPSATSTNAANSKAAEKFFDQGNTLLSNGQAREALQAYRQALQAGSVKGALAAGVLLCDFARTSHGRERILDISEGVADLFQAATNHMPEACAKLSDVLKRGVCGATNLTAAYAWMNVAVVWDNSYKRQLDQLVILMNPAEVQPAQDLAQEYAKGHWPTDLVRPVDEGDPRLQVKGITVGGKEAMVILNRITFTQGDTLDVAPAGAAAKPGTGKLTVTCREIGEDYVLVAVAGESHLKLLSSAKLMQ
jgi:hypothetical protein